MILGEKIMSLRKRVGWSQEELAHELGVSRQSVSKWESSTSIPDIQKIMALAKLFDVSTDYLLRDELDEPVASVCVVGNTQDTVAAQVDVPTAHSVMEALSGTADNKPAHVVTLDEANAFLETTQKLSNRTAFGAFLCAASPVILLATSTMMEHNYLGEEQAMAIGMTVLFCMVAVGVALFIAQESKLSRFEYLSKEVLTLQYGVEAVVRRKQEAHNPVNHLLMIIGVVLCILSLVPLFLHVYMTDLLGLDISVSVMLFIIAIGVFLLVKSDIEMDSFKKLLQEGKYDPTEKLMASRTSWLPKMYWPVVLAIYLIASFTTNRWDKTWIIWAVAGILYPVVSTFVQKFTTLNK
ncbi:helix-turn-helix domain-containing protein [Atopobium fossor]|uniref:helix-turn-helix domain-containing protein n=1 Tax=Atopobium fossor TaxID=39487 RepID=UPI0004205F14|nr:helix-turn-helix transcriptional regulator [Atopobium fossor]